MPFKKKLRSQTVQPLPELPSLKRESKMEALRRTAAIISGNFGVQVVFAGNRAYTDFRRIVVPSLPDNAPDELVDAITGYVDHEIGHILFTDPNEKRPFRDKDKRAQFMTNAVEDVRQEFQTAKLYRGMGLNLDRSAIWSISKIRENWQNDDSYPAFSRFLVLSICWWRAKVGGLPEAQQFLDECGGDMLKVVKHFAARIEKWHTLPSTAAAYDEAKEILAELDKLNQQAKQPSPPPPPPPPQPQQPDEEAGEGGGQGQQDERDSSGETENEECSSDADPDELAESDDAGSSEGSADVDEAADDRGDEDDQGDNDDDAGSSDESAADDEPCEDGQGDGDDQHADGSDQSGDDEGDQGDGGGAADDGAGDEAGDDQGGDDAAGQADAGDDETDADGDDQPAGAAGEGEDDPADGEDDGDTDDGEADGSSAVDDAGTGDDRDADDDGAAEAAGGSEADASDAGDDDAGEDGAGDADDEDGDAQAAGAGGAGDDDGEGAGDDQDGDEAGDEAAGEQPVEDSQEASDGRGSDDVAEGGPSGMRGVIDTLCGEQDREKLEKTSTLHAVMQTEIEVDSSAVTGHRAYTEEFDQVMEPVGEATLEDYSRAYEKVKPYVNVIAGVLTRVLLSRTTATTLRGRHSGAVSMNAISQLRAGQSNVFQTRQEGVKLDTYVELVVDHSGSMDGQKIETAMQTCIALAESLAKIGIPFGISGFTTGLGCDEGQAKDRDLWRRARDYVYSAHGNPELANFERIDPIIEFRYKTPETPFAQMKTKLALMTEQDMGANADGDSIYKIAKRVSRRRESRKVIIVMSDGFPAARQGKNVSGDAAERYMAHVAKLLARTPGLELIGIGIMSDAVKHYYQRHAIINNVADLPAVAMGELKRALMGQ